MDAIENNGPVTRKAFATQVIRQFNLFNSSLLKLHNSFGGSSDEHHLLRLEFYLDEQREVVQGLHFRSNRKRNPGDM
jgi:hypothetical protein